MQARSRSSARSSRATAHAAFNARSFYLAAFLATYFLAAAFLAAVFLPAAVFVAVLRAGLLATAGFVAASGAAGSVLVLACMASAATSFMALAAMFWNCCDSEPHQAIGSTMGLSAALALD